MISPELVNFEFSDTLKKKKRRRNNMNVQEKPTTAIALSLIAGILMMLGAFVGLIIFSIGLWNPLMFGMQTWSGQTGAWVMEAMLSISLVGLAFGAIVIYAAAMLSSKPEKHETWGVMIIIFSILSVIGTWAGFGIGLAIGVIGGILAITWKGPVAVKPPVFVSPQVEHTTSEPSVSVRFCSECGRQINLEAKFCSHCGREAPE